MSSAQGLMTVINDVLDYSKLEAGKMKLESIPYEPLNVVEGSLAAVRASCEERGLYLNMDWDCKIPFRVMGDPNRLRQILLNLLSNAVKFTKQGGISVYILDYQPHESGGSTPMIKFVVKDTGIGISEEHIDLIFNQYQQGSASVARNFGGTGLGLSICKLLVQNMGGTIGLHSEYEKGSSFWFTLPAEVPQDNVDGGPGSLDNSFRTEGVMHILVVEDNKVNQKLLTKMLGRMGHTFDVAGNGMIAVEMTQQKSYDAVLME
jgi:signal transduction histidine kinase